VLVIGYNAELFGGAMHTDLGFAAAWGAFPVLTPTSRRPARWRRPGAAAAGALALSAAQRSLSTPARNIRRRAVQVEGTITFADGRSVALTSDVLNQPSGACAAHGLVGDHLARRRPGSSPSG